MKIYYPAGDRTPNLLNQRQTYYHLSQRGELVMKTRNRDLTNSDLIARCVAENRLCVHCTLTLQLMAYYHEFYLRPHNIYSLERNM